MKPQYYFLVLRSLSITSRCIVSFYRFCMYSSFTNIGDVIEHLIYKTYLAFDLSTLTIVLFVLLRFTDFHYPFDIF